MFSAFKFTFFYENFEISPLLTFTQAIKMKVTWRS